MAAQSSVSISTSTFASEHSNSALSLLEDRRFLRSLLINLLIFVLFIIPLAVCEYGLQPYRRGFFCNDETLRYPFKSNTVTPTMLGLLVGLLPVLFFASIEYWYAKRRRQVHEKVHIIFAIKLPIWVISGVQQIIYYTIGLLITCDMTEMAKYTIGQLRPHFMAVCQPQLLDGSTCADEKNRFRYIEDYVCRLEGYTAMDELEARRSFPSGHSSLAFYAMIYLVCYIQRRLVRSNRLTLHFLQFCLAMLAWFTALSRVMDNWHHWSDVLVGSLIGIGCALLTARFVTRFHRKRELNALFMSHTQHQHDANAASISRQNTAATLDEVISTPPPYMIEAENCFTNEQFSTKV